MIWIYAFWWENRLWWKCLRSWKESLTYHFPFKSFSQYIPLKLETQSYQATTFNNTPYDRQTNCWIMLLPRVRGDEGWRYGCGCRLIKCICYVSNYMHDKRIGNSRRLFRGLRLDILGHRCLVNVEKESNKFLYPWVSLHTHWRGYLRQFILIQLGPAPQRHHKQLRIISVYQIGCLKIL